MWWDILELPPEADKKAIKRAYARLLKQNRPDQNPDGFQALHAAYQQALTWQAQHTTDLDTDITPETEIEPVSEPSTSATVSVASPSAATDPILTPAAPITSTLSQIKLEKIEPAEPAVHTYRLQAELEPTAAPASNAAATEEDEALAQQQALDRQLSADWDYFLQTTQAQLHDKRARQNPQAWHFIEQLASFNDLMFREKVSQELFDSLSELNRRSLEQKVLYIKPAVLNYLNQLFNWDAQWTSLSEYYGSEQADAILAYINSPQQEKGKKLAVRPKELFYWKRSIAAAIDVGLLFVLVKLGGLLQSLTGLELSTNMNHLLITIVWFIAFPLIESSALQASLGKRLLGLKVVDREGNPLRWYHAMWRHLIATVAIIGFKLFIWIHMMFVFCCNMLTQDWITHSYVIKR